MNKELNKEILDSITTHKDFGVMNPVDIGVQCGYKEKDVEVAIESSRSLSKMYEEEKSSKYYFALTVNKFNREEGIDIVAFDLFKRTVSVVKHFDEKDCIIKIREKILAKTKSGTKHVYWENIETGENGVFDIKFPVYDVLVLKDGIVVVCVSRERYKDIVKVSFSGERKTLQIVSPFFEGQELVEYRDKIYEMAEGKIWRIDEKFETVETLHDEQYESVQAFGFCADEIYGYTKTKKFSYGAQKTEVDLKKMGVDICSKRNYRENAYRIIDTENYRMLRDQVYNKKTGERFRIKGLCLYNLPWVDHVGYKNEEREQIISLYSQDILLFVCRDTLIGVLDFNLRTESYYAPLGV